MENSDSVAAPTKRCCRCKATKPIDEFGSNRSREDRKDDYCKPCRNAWSAAWRAKHPERAKEVMRDSVERNRDKRRQAERERYRANPEAHVAKVMAWRQKNREKCADTEARRRARIRCAPEIESIDRLEIYDRDGGRCHICGKKVSARSFHLDHLVPISKGGTHTRANVRIAHAFCNQSRNAGRLPAQLLLVA